MDSQGPEMIVAVAATEIDKALRQFLESSPYKLPGKLAEETPLLVLLIVSRLQKAGILPETQIGDQPD